MQMSWILRCDLTRKCQKGDDEDLDADVIVLDPVINAIKKLH